MVTFLHRLKTWHWDSWKFNGDILAQDENLGPEFHEHEIAQDENPGPESHERYSGIPETSSKGFHWLQFVLRTPTQFYINNVTICRANFLRRYSKMTVKRNGGDRPSGSTVPARGNEQENEKCHVYGCLWWLNQKKTICVTNMQV